MDQERIREYIGALPGVDVDVASQESGAPEIALGDTFFIRTAGETTTAPGASMSAPSGQAASGRSRIGLTLQGLGSAASRPVAELRYTWPAGAFSRPPSGPPGRR